MASPRRSLARRGRIAALAILAWLLGALALLACGGGGDDGDGGRLTAREEERVKAWMGELTPVIRDVAEIDWFDAPDTNRIEVIMRRLESARPPMVRDNIADRAMREFHQALADRASAVTDFMMKPPPTGLLIDFDSLFRRFDEMEAQGNRVRNLALTLAQTIAPDFQDDPEFQAEVQATVNNVSRMFGTGGRRTRTLPSMAPAGNAPSASTPTLRPRTGPPHRYIPPAPTTTP
jgi:hypothetical protein